MIEVEALVVERDTRELRRRLEALRGQARAALHEAEGGLLAMDAAKRVPPHFLELAGIALRKAGASEDTGAHWHRAVFLMGAAFFQAESWLNGEFSDTALSSPVVEWEEAHEDSDGAGVEALDVLEDAARAILGPVEERPWIRPRESQPLTPEPAKA